MSNEDHNHRQLQSTLDEILSEQRKTNGRVGRLEDRTEQHHRILLGSAEEHQAGLVADVQRNVRIVDQVEVGIVWLKRTVWALVAAAIALGGNLALNALS